MNEELIDALENRLEHGEDKESLRVEVLESGHTPEDFEEAFLEATKRSKQSGLGEDNEATFSDTLVETESEIPQSRARGDLYTLEVGRTRSDSGLIGVKEMLKKGWQIGDESLRLMGGFLGSIAFLIIGILLAGIFTGVIFSSDLISGSVSIGLALFVFLAAYIFVVLYLTVSAFAFFRAIIMRREGVKYWPNFWWAMKRIIPLFLISFYVQIITQAGFILFVIPGLIAMVYLGYAQYVLASEDKRGFNALIRSFELVYGRFWAVLGRKLFIVAAIFSIFIVATFAVAVFPRFGVGIILAAIVLLYVCLCMAVSLFESLKTLKPIHTFGQRDKATVVRWLRIVAITGIAFAAFSLYSMVSKIDTAVYFDFLNGKDEESSDVVTFPKGSDSSQSNLITSYLEQVSITAELYKDDNGSYAGVCSDEEGVNTLLRYAYDSGSDNIFCHDDRGWYIAEAELVDSGIFYCVDSEGSSLMQATSRNGYETCQDEAVE